MKSTSFYWAEPQIYTAQLKPQKQLENNRGFWFDIPYNDIQSAGWYFGENPIPGRKELVFDNGQPEWFANQGIIPASGGFPKYNPYNPEFHHKRENFTVKRV